MFKTASGLSFIAVAVLALLQLIPLVSFMLALAGGTLLGILIDVMLVSIFIEAAVGRISRAFLAIPLVAFGGYYLAYAYQTIGIQRETAALHANNPGKVFDFDPNVHALISPNAEALASFYNILVAYVAEPQVSPEKYLSYRLITQDQCSNLRPDSKSRVLASRILLENVWLQSVCLLRFPELPPDNAITVVRHGFDDIWKQDWRIAEQVTELRRGDTVIGSFKTASVWRLPPFPVLRTGCFPRPGNPTWKCAIDFNPSQMFIDAIPENIDRAQFDTPESIMLGIAKRIALDFANFRGFEQNEAALARVAQEPKRVEDESLAILKSILDGDNPQQPLGIFSYTITQIPERLAPLAEAMSKRFAELSKLRINGGQGVADQYLVLASGLAALPPDAFATVSDAIFDAIQNDKALDTFAPLYLRSAGSGIKTLAFYEKEFTSGRFAGSTRVYPVLAICRIGRASPEVVSEMKRQFALDDTSYSESEYKTALLVTLVKLGEQTFVEANRQFMHAKAQAWTDSVLAGKGTTETGPNNCMGQRWAHGYIIPSMEPSLR